MWDKLTDALLTVLPNVYRNRAPARQAAPYVVWTVADKPGAYAGDTRRWSAGVALVSLYCRGDGDEIGEQIETALNAAYLPFDFELDTYEDDTGLTHKGWRVQVI